jgi:hypothetical protein
MKNNLKIIRSKIKKERLNIVVNKKLDLELIRQTYIQNGFNLSVSGKILNVSGNAIKKRLMKEFKDEWANWQQIKKQKLQQECKCCSALINKYSNDYSRKNYCSKDCFLIKNKRFIYNKDEIINALNFYNGKISKVAKKMNISIKSLKKWILKNNILDV